MDLILLLIFVPFFSGLICLILPGSISFSKKIAKFLSILTVLDLIFVSSKLFISSEYVNEFFLVDGLNKFVALAISIFGLLIVVYSIKFINKYETKYYGYILWTLGASFGAVLSNDFRVLIVFWGFLGLTLYMLINQAGAIATSSAKKTFIIVGGSDALMLLGIGIIWYLTGTFQMNKINIPLGESRLPILAFLCLVVASFAKAGAMPFHTWIPDMAVVSPVPVTAFLPASLDKLLGIYLLARICLNIFTFHSSLLPVFLMFIGAITIIAAVFMAMVQHDLKKLLSYHAVSQVGYMVLGIGTGTPIGIAGGIFHMLNNAIYKSCLFLCGGSVENKTGTSDLDKLGGLAKFMPLSFVSCLVAALSISGVPPFNGFVSKWMIYQGIITRINESYSILDVIFLVSAVFGSALTLASFMKLLHAVFLGQRSENVNNQDFSEVHWTMWLPQVILAGLCIVFGVFAFQVPLKYFIFPTLSLYRFTTLPLSGLWSPRLATLLIFIGLLAGIIIYLLSNIKIREVSSFVGGESLPSAERVTGVDFYQTIKDIGFFKACYFLAEKKFFDIYDWGKNIVLGFGNVLSAIHTGNLHTYLTWCLIGILILFFVVMK
jgi:multicomponent Na+:H+ antiporter subunit A